ncbi:oxidoreductase [Arenibacter sp. F20364]|uniref:oxidoreductase n=1 Tax=Arenibacter sp. F20364 TaxID=2926415 RepID=UPI001FF323F4|nr:oxidoreductase [Arenibacter sp. F20364]MCK0190275.1 oxidoreductase [Arenibacter sp. F20364]
MNKVVLITGASSGMGKTTAKLLLKEGFIVYGAARRVDNMNDLKLLGAKILLMDVTRDSTTVSGVDEIIKNEGRIDVLINNAGLGYYGAIEEVAIEDARYQLEVNVFGAARLMQLALPYMRKNQFGKIVNISSIGGKLANPYGGWYHASKFALEALSDSLRMEVKQFGIDVIVIEPGGVKSEWSDIAMKNARKVSEKGVYGTMVDKMIETGEKFKAKNAEPELIANLILKAITVNKPKTRYSGGFMAKPLLLMRKMLSDKMMDKIILSQFKN